MGGGEHQLVSPGIVHQVTGGLREVSGGEYPNIEVPTHGGAEAVLEKVQLLRRGVDCLTQPEDLGVVVHLVLQDPDGGLEDRVDAGGGVQELFQGAKFLTLGLHHLVHTSLEELDLYQVIETDQEADHDADRGDGGENDAAWSAEFYGRWDGEVLEGMGSVEERLSLLKEGVKLGLLEAAVVPRPVIVPLAVGSHDDVPEGLEYLGDVETEFHMCEFRSHGREAQLLEVYLPGLVGFCKAGEVRGTFLVQRGGMEAVGRCGVGHWRATEVL